MLYQYPDARILIFAKAPIAGHTKTRMQPELSPAQSASLQSKLIVHSCQTACSSNWCAVELWCTPNQHSDVFQDMQSTHKLGLHTQQGQDLGDRIWTALEQAPDKIALILGTDCPDLNQEHIDSLFSGIYKQDYDLGLIPAKDGGYVAMICRYPVKGLFTDINWGSDEVFKQTYAAAQQHSLKIQVFTALSDVDYYTDYVQICQKIPNLAV